MLPNKLKGSYERCLAELGLPFILKDTLGRKGNNNYLIKTKEDFDRAIRQASALDVWLIAQKYIPNDCDYRLLVMGGEISLVLKRSRLSNNTHLNNVSYGGSAQLVDLDNLSSQLTNIAAMSAKLLQLQIAGVDIIQDKNTKLWYCLEVNKSPQICTGALTKQKQMALAKYLTQRLYN